jgi:hypothetical protein
MIYQPRKPLIMAWFIDSSPEHMKSLNEDALKDCDPETRKALRARHTAEIDQARRDGDEEMHIICLHAVPNGDDQANILA